MASQNGGRKRSRGRSNSVEERKPRVATPEQKARQARYHVAALEKRKIEGTFTEENEKDLLKWQALVA